MATDKFPKLKEGVLKFPERGILSFIANGVIPNFSVVILVAPPAGETLPRVATTTTVNDAEVLGIVVGGSGDVAAGNAADAAGDAAAQATSGNAYNRRRAISFAVFDSMYRIFQHNCFPLIIKLGQGNVASKILPAFLLPAAAAIEQTLMYQFVIVPGLYYPIFL